MCEEGGRDVLLDNEIASDGCAFLGIVAHSRIQVIVMQEKIRMVYIHYGWLRCGAFAGLLACAFLLYWLSATFLAWAWYFLPQLAPQLPALWQAQRFATLLPLAGLLCLSLALLLLWGIVPVALFVMVRSWWHTWHERRRFSQELREVEQLVEQISAGESRHRAMVAGSFSPSYSPASSQPAAATIQIGVTQQTKLVRLLDMQAPEPVAAARVKREEPYATVGMRGAVGKVGAVGAAVPHTPPPLARGQLRLVPRPEEDEEDETDDFPEIEPGQAYGEPADLEVGVGLHTGFHRKDAPNEDALFEIRGTHTAGPGLQQVGLFVVADGMGNAGMGHEASRLAISTLSAVMVPALLSNTKADLADLLKEGVQSANLAVYRRNRELAESQCKIGTTMTAALMLGSTVSIANVGNSRAYLYRQSQGLLRVTQDHTIAASLARDETMSVHSKPVAARQGVLERYLGRQALVDVDVFALNLLTSDILLLCSDGLWALVGDAEIAHILATPCQHPTRLSGMLVQHALNYGGADNISVIVVRCPAGQEE